MSLGYKRAKRRRGGAETFDPEKLQSYDKVIKYFNREPMRTNTFFTDEIKAFRDWSERPTE